MIFNGYVQLRRGLLEHVHDGRLSLIEFAVLTTLILLADKSSGSGTINANTLGTFVGEGLDYESENPRNRQRGKQRVLRNLEAKGYIYRHIVPHSKRAYRYWVNKYLLTDGANKSRRVDIAQVLITKDVKDIRYMSAVAETVAEGVAEGVAETVASNEKEKYKEKEKEPVRTGVSASLNDIKSDTQSDAAKHTKGEACALQCAPHCVPHVNGTLPVLVPGEDCHWKDPVTGRRLRFESPADFALISEARKLQEGAQ